MGRLDYLEQYGSSNTVRAYREALKNFFEMIYGEGEPLEDLAERYFSIERNYREDIQNFMVHLKGYAPMTVKQKITGVRVFLLENEIELPQRFWRRLRGRIKGSRALTLDKVPSNEELRKIITHLPVHGKALYLTLAASGMRIGEALQLTLKDLELDRDPAKVSIRGEYTKTGNPRIAFISIEAKQTITEWLKVREEYLEAAAGKSHMHKKSAEDPRVFPFTSTTARVMWRNALKKSRFKEQDRRTNWHTIHPHVLRKFFRSQMGTVIPVDVAEALMGHEGYLTEVYRKYPDPEKTLGDFYRRGEHVLLIFTEAAEIGKLRQEIEERNRQLQTLVNGLTAENIQLKEKMKELNDSIQDLTGWKVKAEEEMTALERRWTALDETTRELVEGRLAIIEELRKIRPDLVTTIDQARKLQRSRRRARLGV